MLKKTTIVIYFLFNGHLPKIDDECAECGNGGNLIVCDKCDKSFHNGCTAQNLSSQAIKIVDIWLCDDCSDGVYWAAVPKSPAWPAIVITWDDVDEKDKDILMELKHKDMLLVKYFGDGKV